ncbi:hypothetical protein ACHAWO_009992 [Cyclotella atomus]|uniref:Prolyl 4-hydroxylase alpha subunit Fe(2+) 2OG dioxygenase domain-containing protein n=1 Tax=Cyclotella atomus TaxID=382360 RepID=A0ABD3QK59_9STRA
MFQGLKTVTPNGVTSFCPTMVSSSRDTYRRIIPLTSATERSTIAEPLSLPEYTESCDFGYDRMSSVHQPSRSINVLLYLNDVEEGGETSFSKMVNAET